MRWRRRFVLVFTVAAAFLTLAGSFTSCAGEEPDSGVRAGERPEQRPGIVVDG